MELCEEMASQVFGPALQQVEEENRLLRQLLGIRKPEQDSDTNNLKR
jgi:hypothetical protein